METTPTHPTANMLDPDNVYPDFVQKLAKNPAEILASLDEDKINMIHALLGMLSELGETASILKAHIMYGKPLDTYHLKEEMGDSEWYSQLLRNTIMTNRREILLLNMEKLRERYKKMTYSDEAALNREDKLKVIILDVPEIKRHQMKDISMAHAVIIGGTARKNAKNLTQDQVNAILAHLGENARKGELIEVEPGVYK